jgi:hypothetical protein
MSNVSKNEGKGGDSAGDTSGKRMQRNSKDKDSKNSKGKKGPFTLGVKGIFVH